MFINTLLLESTNQISNMKQTFCVDGELDVLAQCNLECFFSCLSLFYSRYIFTHIHTVWHAKHGIQLKHKQEKLWCNSMDFSSISKNETTHKSQTFCLFFRLSFRWTFQSNNSRFRCDNKRCTMAIWQLEAKNSISRQQQWCKSTVNCNHNNKYLKKLQEKYKF